jgi:hypothetical protein
MMLIFLEQEDEKPQKSKKEGLHYFYTSPNIVMGIKRG